MKTLQCNFTTPEQSNRLLELGIPEWTADLRYRICKANDSVLGNPYLTKGKKYIGSHFNSSLPCWSVGRLIEIMTICNNFGTCTIYWMSFCKEQSPLQTIYDELCAGITQGLLDFSKLEE